jgi:FkbM family methyltransferase
LDQISFDASDIVVDCGANYGDLSLVLKERLDPENYIAFEPGDDEYECLARNVPGARVFKKGLSNFSGVTTFYLSSAGGDSSIIEPESYTRKVEIETTTLDVIMDELQLKSVKLLKLEAEGFEPEILYGANRFLNICEYVAIDGGNERGKKKEETFSSQTNFLIRAGFEMVGVFLPWQRALFRKAASVRRSKFC